MSEETIGKWYAAWETDDWAQLDTLAAADFRFSSPLDDRIDKAAFKAQCWDTQHELIERFDLLRVTGNDRQAFVLYECHKKKGNVFRNVEYFQLRDNKVTSLECYFGGQASFPSAVDTVRT